MKQFFCEALEMMGAKIRNHSLDEIAVHVPQKTMAAPLFNGQTDPTLSFSVQPCAPGTIKVVPGSQTLERLRSMLLNNAARHGFLPVNAKLGRKRVMERYTIFSGKVKKLSVRRSWQTTMICHLKATFSSLELVDELISIKVPHKGMPEIIENEGEHPPEIIWEKVPPIKQIELKDLLVRGMDHAEKIVLDRAEDRRKEDLINLYKTIARMKYYYQQIKKETTSEEDNIKNADNEYRQRKAEEVLKTRANIKIVPVAVETVSNPIQHITLEIERRGINRTVVVTFDCYRDQFSDAVICDICLCKTEAFGIDKTARVVCKKDFTNCDFCGKEIVGDEVRSRSVCSTCGLTICDEAHTLFCDNCKNRYCPRHIHSCESGCNVCEACSVICPECGEHKKWCGSHVLINTKGLVTCYEHALLCVTCKEPYPSVMTEPCSVCGQTVCKYCWRLCSECGGVFCRQHLDDKSGNCIKCEENIKNQVQRQIKLF